MIECVRKYAIEASDLRAEVTIEGVLGKRDAIVYRKGSGVAQRRRDVVENIGHVLHRSALKRTRFARTTKRVLLRGLHCRTRYLRAPIVSIVRESHDQIVHLHDETPQMLVLPPRGVDVARLGAHSFHVVARGSYQHTQMFAYGLVVVGRRGCPCV